jgi:hypothetical protein
LMGWLRRCCQPRRHACGHGHGYDHSCCAPEVGCCEDPCCPVDPGCCCPDPGCCAPDCCAPCCN